MEYTIAPSVDGAFVVLTIKGEITRRNVMQLNLQAHALGRELRVSRYLVDVTEATNVDSALEIYKLAYSDMQHAEGIDRYARVATLVRPGDHSHDFMETVARNAGHDVRLFTDRDEAERHLREGGAAGTTAAGAGDP